jgi:hypothetical protein
VGYQFAVKIFSFDILNRNDILLGDMNNIDFLTEINSLKSVAFLGYITVFAILEELHNISSSTISKNSYLADKRRSKGLINSGFISFETGSLSETIEAQ